MARGDAGRACLPDRKSEVALLLRQWLSFFLKPYEYMSLVAAGDQGDNELMVFQLLDGERKSILVKPFLDKDDRAELEALYTMKLQPLELWWPHSAPPVQPHSLDAFVLQEPAKCDILAACGGTSASRAGITVWSAMPSDVEGCLGLRTPQKLQSRPVDLMAGHTPVLSLIDALSERQYVGVDTVVEHKVGVFKYDRRKITSRRAYLQCVLSMEALSGRGLPSLAKGRPPTSWPC